MPGAGRISGRIVLYLASTSPRRRQLLLEAGIPFTCVAPGEEPEAEGTPRERAVERARRKAAEAAVTGAPGLVLGVDTVVELDGREIGKPGDAADAATTILALSGRRHHVHTAHCLRRHPDDGLSRIRVTSAIVEFRSVDPVALRRYVESEAWAGKAGGYGIQDPEAAFARLVEGERDTVIGLSLAAVRELLREARQDQGSG